MGRLAIRRTKYTRGDYDRAIDFFRRLYRASDVVPFWLPARFEYAEYLVAPLYKHRGNPIDWKETIYLWEAGDRDVVGVLCSENPDANMFLHVMPGFSHLLEEMVVFAEEQVVRGVLSLSEIKIWSRRDDPLLEPLLEKSGYERHKDVEYLNWRDLKAPLDEISMPAGHELHDMTSEAGLDLQHKIDRGTAAFDSPTYPIWIYRSMQSGPSYRKDLDLYTTDSHGQVTSFCTIWHDRELNIGYFEPVGTAPAHQRRGLGRAVMSGALHALKRLGATVAFVGGYSLAANALYASVGFAEYALLERWVREL